MCFIILGVNTNAEKGSRQILDDNLTIFNISDHSWYYSMVRSLAWSHNVWMVGFQSESTTSVLHKSVLIINTCRKNENIKLVNSGFYSVAMSTEKSFGSVATPSPPSQVFQRWCRGQWNYLQRIIYNTFKFHHDITHTCNFSYLYTTP